jgi:hypothetical protein
MLDIRHFRHGFDIMGKTSMTLGFLERFTRFFLEIKEKGITPNWLKNIFEIFCEVENNNINLQDAKQQITNMFNAQGELHPYSDIDLINSVNWKNIMSDNHISENQTQNVDDNISPSESIGNGTHIDALKPAPGSLWLADLTPLPKTLVIGREASALLAAHQLPQPGLMCVTPHGAGGFVACRGPRQYLVGSGREARTRGGGDEGDEHGQRSCDSR